MPIGVPNGLTIPSRAPAETFDLAERLAAVAAAGDVLCLWGELGAGKTVFAKGFGAGLGVGGTTVASPSFILMAEHLGRLPLFHIDLYRLGGAADAVEGGLIDERQASGVTLIEWPERLGDALPEPRLDVRIEITGESSREIRLEAIGEGLARYLAGAGT
jgi:tRNA threonylcarbamoyladenosine biosynthesis protein TsaE